MITLDNWCIEFIEGDICITGEVGTKGGEVYLETVGPITAIDLKDVKKVCCDGEEITLGDVSKNFLKMLLAEGYNVYTCMIFLAHYLALGKLSNSFVKAYMGE